MGIHKHTGQMVYGIMRSGCKGKDGWPAKVWMRKNTEEQGKRRMGNTLGLCLEGQGRT